MSSGPSSVLVVGATGFIAQALLRHLKEKNIPAMALAFTDRGHQNRLAEQAGLKIFYADSNDGPSIERSLEKAAPEVVVNLAAAGVRPEQRQPDNLARGNAGLVEKLLRACAKSPPRLFLHAGSWSEYGPAVEATPITEDHPVTPVSDYGRAKAAASALGTSLAPDLGVPMVTLRLFHVYGNGEIETRLIPSLIKGLGADQAIDLTPGDQVRDFIYVDDAARAFVAAWDAKNLEAHRTYNVCSGQPVTVRSVVEKVADAMNKPRDLLHFGALSKRDEEEPWVVGDGATFAAATGWRPSVTLSEGIRRMVAANG
ncbi:MAG: NAD(P)-dependent oxidoreductase [Proteobacteria bacterium]|nr:NAD(P)-dependent oxidoreductase [Pseudomonadota bacterium]